MTLFEELGVEYKEVDGILYPLLSVDEAEYNLRPMLVSKADEMENF